MALDIIFVVDEANHAHWENLKEKFPYAKKIDAVDSKLETLTAASKAANTRMFFVVDGSNWRPELFDFRPTKEMEMYVHRFVQSNVIMLNKRFFTNIDLIDIPNPDLTEHYLGYGIKFVKGDEYVPEQLDVFMIRNVKCNPSENWKRLLELAPHAKMIDSTSDALAAAKHDGASMCYVVSGDSYMEDFDFSFIPPKWDRSFIHWWGKSPDVVEFLGVTLAPINCNMDSQVKYHDALGSTQKIWLDVFMLTYDEPNGDENWQKLLEKCPRAKRIEKVKGIAEAHLAAAKIAHETGSTMFYVVDGDTTIDDSFDFSFVPEHWDQVYVHIWKSRNAANGLEYGYGGVKLFPTKLLVEEVETYVDFTTTLSSGVKLMDETVATTNFNSDPFRAWRGAFRECVKLSSRAIDGQIDDETIVRLMVWRDTDYSDVPFGKYIAHGVMEGIAFGRSAKDKDELAVINDFNWLRDRFGEE